ncbi:uncharacterized protein LOC143292634 [Babylonia areolata]|uniref:uncharacterized protein LOC143292634 n=1 Tax=Babylonia areolata TaxID=304850 RepID=UPI003FD4A5C0
MKVAVEGCCHGELDKIYETLQYLENVNNIKVDLLLICGDFQAVRNRDDFKAMAVPPKYQKLNSFYKYYAGEKVAPVLTIFIGGNHEASNYMQELPYGGWVAKNIYYMGYANVVQVGGLRIGGLSGIYKRHDYFKGHFEYPPYTEDTKRSVYHIRNIEVYRLKQLSRPLDIFMSHDWPTDIARYGNMSHLFSKKPFLKQEVMDGSLGSPPAAELLHKLQPDYWFAAHLHVKYTAQVQHTREKCTKFLSLDKCLPRRQFLQVLDFPDKEKGPVSISLDPEWLCLLQNTNHLMHLGRSTRFMPGPQSTERNNFEVTDEEMARVKELFGGNLKLPENFIPTAPTLAERNNKPAAPPVMVNPQTALLCTMLDLTDPNAVHLGISNHQSLAPHLDPEHLETLEGDSEGSEDDVPTDISSSANTSYANSSLDMSDSFSSPLRAKLSSGLLAGAAISPTAQVDDDDEEFKAILAAQQRTSQQMRAASESNNKSSEQKNGSSSDDQPKVASSPQAESIEDELAPIMAAKHQNKEKPASSSENTQKLEDDLAAYADKSSSDIDSSSQDSQDGLDRTGYQEDSSQASTTDCMEVSAGSDSPTEGKGACPPGKHPSPNNISAQSPSVKKLKRRNVSMYSSSGTEEEPC